MAQARTALMQAGGPVVAIGHSLERAGGAAPAAGAAAAPPPAGAGAARGALAVQHQAGADRPGAVGRGRAHGRPRQHPPELAPALFGASMPLALARDYAARLGGESSTALLEAQLPQPVPYGWLHGRPVLVLGAGEDQLIPADAVRRCALWHGRNAEFLPGHGHLMMLEPDWPALADRLLGWLQGLPG
ncbi:hypothetical protein ACFFMP_04700 [Pseudoroseomonas cervicalis]|uniref:hypothetical protein n=1 Tax=Teichococcus cervicalis TaxID=204525 RepID=UPI0035ED24E1